MNQIVQLHDQIIQNSFLLIQRIKPGRMSLVILIYSDIAMNCVKEIIMFSSFHREAIFVR